MAGRKTKLTHELIEEICGYISDGLSEKDACDLCGISQGTLCSWKQDAEEKKASPNLYLKIELSESIKKAEIKFKQSHIKNINKAGEVSWQASAWMLERKFPDEFGKKERKSENRDIEIEDLTPLGDLINAKESDD